MESRTLGPCQFTLIFWESLDPRNQLVNLHIRSVEKFRHHCVRKLGREFQAEFSWFSTDLAGLALDFNATN
jgi:hypothetical protein